VPQNRPGRGGEEKIPSLSGIESRSSRSYPSHYIDLIHTKVQFREILTSVVSDLKMSQSELIL